MTKKEIISEIKEKKYFDIRELVCKHTYDKFGEKAWQFFSCDYLHALLVIRKSILGKGMVCNNWHTGGSYSQRGLRCNCCDMIKEKKSIYLSAHCTGQGGDFTVMGMTAEEARKKIKEYGNVLPVPVRLEDGVNWLHMDTYSDETSVKVSLFKA